MRRAYDVAGVRAAEAALMARLPAGTLMTRASTALAATCARLLGRTYGKRVVLLVGSGDNGGDALHAGAVLAARGARVDALLLSDRAHPDGLGRLRGSGGRVHTSPDGSHDDVPLPWLELVDAADLVLDGVVGIGGRGPLREPAASLAVAARRSPSNPWLVAVDLPSGVDADTGDVPGAAFAADVTVTFGCAKPGLLVGPGHGLAGVVEVVDIGLDATLPVDAPVLVLDADDVTAAWPYPGPDDDKYTRGVLGVVAGSEQYPGAAVLCVGGALGAGAGMVRYAGDGAAAAAVHARWPEVVTGTGRVQAWVAGPGLGTDDAAAERLHEVLHADVPVLVDADGLTVLAQHPDWLADRGGPTVLTPHDREYERFGSPVGTDRLTAARTLAERLGVVVLLKGSTTVVAEPGGGPCRVNPTGTGWLATAGSGDVLSGVLGALLAAGRDPANAAAMAAFVHGLAGRLAAASAPATSLQVAQAVPAAVRALAAAEGPGDVGGRIGG